jgi:hypothetical protein
MGEIQKEVFVNRHKMYFNIGGGAAIVVLAALGATVINGKEPDLKDTIFISAPSFEADLFVECVDNPYFPLIPEAEYRYETETDEGIEETVVMVTEETKRILGIQATVVRDTVSMDGELIEDTFDWFAQDDRGNVWYLGEDTKEYEDGEVVSTEGSWEAGVDGAVAGIIMLGNPREGDAYRQEYFKGEAEDLGAVLSLAERVSVPAGSFEDVLMTADENPLDPELEHKFYAPGVGLVRVEKVDGGEETVLVRFVKGNSSSCNIDDDNQ